MTEQILVIKHGALGDIVQGFDAFESLRKSAPTTHITLLTGPAFADFMQRSGWFDEVVIDKRHSPLNLVASWHLRSFLRRRWDKVIDLQCSQRTQKYARFVRSGVRWFGTAQSASDPMPDFTGVNNRDRMMVAVEKAGASPMIARLDWLIPASFDGDMPQKYCMLIAGCSAANPSKRWPPQAYADIARAALSNGITPVLIGTAADAEVNQEIRRAVPDVHDMTSRTSLFQLAALASKAVFVIGNDTGPVFLAARAGAPTWMLMGPETNPEMSAPVGPKAKWLRASPLASLDAAQVCQAIGLE
jgi:ADP-heptose:LPS heptosyltransferase